MQKGSINRTEKQRTLSQIFPSEIYLEKITGLIRKKKKEIEILESSSTPALPNTFEKIYKLNNFIFSI